MKTIKNKYLLAILFFASISACKKFDTTITLNAPDIADVIVVNSLFNNDSLLQVNISRSKNYFTKDLLKFLMEMNRK